jgi:putative ABC transport system ATP-binding protein
MNSTEKESMIQVEKLNKTYTMGEEKCIAVNDVSLKILPQEIVAIMGKSGSGKTTLLNMIGTMDNPTSGRVILEGKDMTDLKQNIKTRFRRNHIGFVFQFFHLLPMLTLEENILLPLNINHAKIDREYYEELVNMIGIQNKLSYYPSQLSGGQQQRGAIARALIHKPSILLADEPTGNLDSATSEEVVSLLFECVKKYNQTFLYVTHDNDMGKKADKIYYMEDGRLK